MESLLGGIGSLSPQYIMIIKHQNDQIVEKCVFPRKVRMEIELEDLTLFIAPIT